MLSTGTVVLRPLRHSDAEVLASWASDPWLCAAADWSTDRPEEYHRAFHRRLIDAPPPDLIRLAAVLDDDVVGYVDLHGTEPSRRELGYLVGDSRRWGRGLGGQIARAGLEYGFTRTGLHEIWAEALAANTASVRILQGLGMVEGEPGDAGIYLGVATRFRRFTLDADAWRRGESALSGRARPRPAPGRRTGDPARS